MIVLLRCTIVCPPGCLGAVSLRPNQRLDARRSPLVFFNLELKNPVLTSRLQLLFHLLRLPRGSAESQRPPSLVPLLGSLGFSSPLFPGVVTRGGIVASTRNEGVDLHASNLPDVSTESQATAVRKRLMDMFQPFGAISVRVIHKPTKNYG